MQKIEEEIGGDISKMGGYIESGKTTTGKLINAVTIITHMANGHISKHNADIDFGLSDGEKLSFYSVENLLDIFDASDFGQIKDALFMTTASDTEYTVPDGVKLKNEEEVDVVLKEIEEKNV